MKNLLAAAAILTLTNCSYLQAEEVSDATLRSLGLGSMQRSTDESAAQVRGQFANLLSASSISAARLTQSNAGSGGAAVAPTVNQGSAASGFLQISSGNPLRPAFIGSFQGAAGNSASSFVSQFLSTGSFSFSNRP